MRQQFHFPAAHEVHSIEKGFKQTGIYRGGKCMKPHVVLLNGPSSSGKSTLARALQALIMEQTSERYEVVSIDDFLKMSPDETIRMMFSKFQTIMRKGIGNPADRKRRHHRSCDH